MQHKVYALLVLVRVVVLEVVSWHAFLAPGGGVQNICEMSPQRSPAWQRLPNDYG